MSKEREALKLALEALDNYDGQTWEQTKEAITAIKEALAQPEQEPVAWANQHDLQNFDMKVRTSGDPLHTVPLYTTPPQRKWVGLTPQERDEINQKVFGIVPHYVAFHHAIEAKLKEKNT